MKSLSYNTLIFDLGGVIINLDTSLTIKAFGQLAGQGPEEITRLVNSSPVFHQLEKGLISESLFRDEVRSLLRVNVSDIELDTAWNAMILDLPQYRLRQLSVLSESYNLFLLSNTNTIHLQRVRETFNPLEAESLENYFTRAYYSQEMGKRKPDIEIYQEILQENNLNPRETLFLDDTRENIIGAQKAGIQTFLVEHPDDWKTLIDE